MTHNISNARFLVNLTPQTVCGASLLVVVYQNHRRDQKIAAFHAEKSELLRQLRVDARAALEDTAQIKREHEWRKKSVEWWEGKEGGGNTGCGCWW